MKSNNHLNGQGYLLPEYYQAWANYFVKFLNAYKDNDITFWGLTAQNEPWDGIVPKNDVQHNIRRNGILQRSFRKIRNKHKDLIRQESNSDDEDEENNEMATPAAIAKDVKERQNLNLSYLQSLPANSLVVLDNDSMWREVYLDSLKTLLTNAHINSLDINVSNIIKKISSFHLEP